MPHDSDLIDRWIQGNWKLLVIVSYSNYHASSSNRTAPMSFDLAHITPSASPPPRPSHGRGDHKMGVDILTGETGDMEQCGITECFRVKQQILLSGTEAAEMIIRVDDIIKCVPRQREQ